MSSLGKESSLGKDHIALGHIASVAWVLAAAFAARAYAAVEYLLRTRSLREHPAGDHRPLSLDTPMNWFELGCRNEESAL